MTGAGARLPVLLVHGYSCSPRHWAEAADRLGGSLDLRLVALPGHGEAPLPRDGVLDFETCVQQVLAEAEALPEPAALVGHSLGGMIGIACAAREPQRFTQLVLVDAFPKLGPPPPFSKSFWKGTPPSLKSRVVREMMAARRRLPDALWRSVVALDGRPLLARVPIPVSGLYGDRGEGDHPTLRDKLLALGLEQVADLSLHFVANAGHFVMLEQPEAFYRQLGEILSGQAHVSALPRR